MSYTYAQMKAMQDEAYARVEDMLARCGAKAERIYNAVRSRLTEG